MTSTIAVSNVGMIYPPKLHVLPSAVPVEGAVRIELEAGIPVFRVALSVQDRIENLIEKQQEAGLSPAENQELDRYEEIDDFISFVNRLTRNAIDIRI